MKTVVFLAALVALTVAGTVPPKHNVETKPVDADFVRRQKLVFSLLEVVQQRVLDAEYYKIGSTYDVEANISNYTSKEAVELFLEFYRNGFLPKHTTFTVFSERMAMESIVLFNLFYAAKDFDTFYKTAAYARVHFNDGQFLYAYYVAVLHRADTQGIVLPAPYEMYPQYFVSTDTMLKAYRTKMYGGLIQPEFAEKFGIVKEHDYYVYYSNYSSPWFTGSEEQKLSYFTEDIGMNSYYYYFTTYYPFWAPTEVLGKYKEFRGESTYFFYQQLIARYYLERLTNGMGEIPELSWYKPIKTGYTCQLSSYYPFFQRNDYYQINTVENYDDLQFLITHENIFLYYLEQGKFKAYGQDIDLHNSKSIEFVANYWFSYLQNYDDFDSSSYMRFYELTGLHLLAGTPKQVTKYAVQPSALELAQTSLRDPAFYQFYKHILDYIIKYKEYLEPYNKNQLFFQGVKINDVKVDKLVTFFDFFDFDISNDMFYSPEELKSKNTIGYKVRQPRLAHKPFTVSVDVKSDVATDAVFKIFLGPKFDGKGYPIRIEDNWMNFIELDWFKQKLTPGQNKIERSSEDFFFYKEDSISATEVYKMLDQGKVPVDMSENFFYQPNRMMLPKGTKGGFPFQLYVVVYPYTALPSEYKEFSKHIVDGKPFGYPFDRPIEEMYFKQPNIYYEDVFIYHEGAEHPNWYNVPGWTYKNEVPKH